MKANKENIVSAILSELQLGKNWKDTLSVINGKFRLSERTFDKYWKIALERHGIAQALRQKDLNDIVTQSDKERLERAILTREQALEELTEDFLKLKGICFGESFESDEGKVILAGFQDEIRAKQARMSIVGKIAELEGWNAPSKHALTDSEGMDLDYDILPIEVLQALINNSKRD